MQKLGRNYLSSKTILVDLPEKKISFHLVIKTFFRSITVHILYSAVGSEGV